MKCTGATIKGVFRLIGTLLFPRSGPAPRNHNCPFTIAPSTRTSEASQTAGSLSHSSYRSTISYIPQKWLANELSLFRADFHGER